MSPKVAFALFVFGCALLALANAERLTRLQRRPVRPRTAPVPSVPCCPCPDEDVDYDAGAQRRYMRPYIRTVVVPEDCKCPCDSLGPGVEATPNPIAIYEKDTPRRG